MITQLILTFSSSVSNMSYVSIQWDARGVAEDCNSIVTWCPLKRYSDVQWRSLGGKIFWLSLTTQELSR